MKKTAKVAAKKAPAKRKVAPKKPIKAGTSRESAAHRKAHFIEAYIQNGGNATQAAITAGYSEKTATVQASQLLTDLKVKEAIAARLKDLGKITGLTTERTLLEVARLAYADPRKLFSADGKLKPIHELDDDTAAIVASVEVDELKSEDVVIGLTKKIKVWDKNPALDKAMKHLGLFEKDNNQRNPLLDMTADQLSKRAAALAEKARGRT